MAQEIYFIPPLFLTGGSSENHPKDAGQSGSGAYGEVRTVELCVQWPGRSRHGGYSTGRHAAHSSHAAKGGKHRRGAVGE